RAGGREPSTTSREPWPRRGQTPCSRPRGSTRGRSRSETSRTTSPDSGSRCGDEPARRSRHPCVRRARADPGRRPGRRVGRGPDGRLDESGVPGAHACGRTDRVLEPLPARALAQGRHERARPARRGDPGRLRCRHAARARAPGGCRVSHGRAILLPPEDVDAEARDPQGFPRGADAPAVRGRGPPRPGRIDDERVERVSLLRPQEIPSYVADGLFDLGITGQDWVAETGADVEVLTSLAYAKSGTGHGTRIVLAVPADHPATGAKEIPPGTRISTEFLNLTRRY